MVSKLQIIFLSFLLILVYGGEADQENNVTIFVFGDSIFDPGNNNYDTNITSDSKANRWPYGETYFNFTTGRYCDGRIIPDFIAMNASLPPWTAYLQQNGTQKSFRHGANFAAGGAHALSENNSNWINLKEQLSFFKSASNILREEVGEEEAEKILMEAVYMTSIGGDDYATFIQDTTDPTQTQINEYRELIIGKIIQVVKEIYEMGGRKFAFQTVGPMGCTPQSLQDYDIPSNRCYEPLNDLIRQHNNAFNKTAQELANELQDFNYLIFDYFSSLYHISKNPSEYGFKVGDSACCGSGTNRASDCGLEPYELCSNPNEYVFFDGDHPGDRTNSILSELMWSGESKFTSPINFKQLLELQIIPNISLQHHAHHNVAIEFM